MTAVNLVWGPAAQGIAVGNGSDTTLTAGNTLNDADNKAALVFTAPKTTNVTKIGFNISTFVGTPPAFNVGLVTVDATGAPTVTGYAGSSATSYTPTGTGWVWVTLVAPVALTAGDTLAAQIWPGATPPDVSNYIRLVTKAYLISFQLPMSAYYTTGWLTEAGWSTLSAYYSDGTIVGLPITAVNEANISTATTPDEVGDLFQVPVGMTVGGVRFTWPGAAASAPFTLVLYDAANTVLATVTCADEDMWFGSNTTRQLDAYFDTPVTLAADTNYRLVWKPTSTSTVRYGGFTFESAASRSAVYEGSRWQHTQRTDAGAWAEDTTKLVWFGLIVTGLTAAAASGGAYGFVT